MTRNVGGFTRQPFILPEAIQAHVYSERQVNFKTISNQCLGTEHVEYCPAACLLALRPLPWPMIEQG
jgi:hypothetical protein